MTQGDSIKASVRDHYAQRAIDGSSCCGPAPTRACGCGTQSASVAKSIGYTDEQLADLPAGADLGLGCGNPIGLAHLEPGQTVLDLGSGGGIDCFLAAKIVGPEGRVIGVDMTPEMLDRARANAVRTGFANVEFRLGEIEHLPVADSSVDVILSNCVINLSPDKPAVFGEAWRVLAPGGHMVVSDLVLASALPASVRNSMAAYAQCIAGAGMRDEYLGAIAEAGFTHVEVLSETAYAPGDDLVSLIAEDASLADISQADLRAAAEAVRSITVRASKPS